MAPTCNIVGAIVVGGVTAVDPIVSSLSRPPLMTATEHRMGPEAYVPDGTERLPNCFWYCPFGADKLGVAMKWILVVLIGGVTPVQTDVQFDKLSDCLSAEEQLRNTYADAYEAWDKSAAINIERRRDYRKAREFQERRLANTGTCIPHAGTDHPAAVTRSGEQPTATTSPQPPPH